MKIMEEIVRKKYSHPALDYKNETEASVSPPNTPRLGPRSKAKHSLPSTMLPLPIINKPFEEGKISETLLVNKI